MVSVIIEESQEAKERRPTAVKYPVCLYRSCRVLISSYSVFQGILLCPASEIQLDIGLCGGTVLCNSDCVIYCNIVSSLCNIL